jgi:hypothetical protein
MVNVAGDVYEALCELARRNDRPITRQLRAILVEALKREGLWPR